MLDPKAEEVEISIAGKDFTIRQSPGILQSNREGGTTGAVLWKSSIYFAEWLDSAQSTLFRHGILDSQTVVLELGSGVSGLVPCVLSPRVKNVVATDQQYALKLLQENINANKHVWSRLASQHQSKRQPSHSNIDVLALDWDTDDITSVFRAHELRGGVDAVFACDCIYNYALIAPFIQTCVDICKIRANTRSQGHRDTESARQTICIVAQQLRQPEVFEQWLEAFIKDFRVWRVPSSKTTDDTTAGRGSVVHVGVLRAECPE